MDINHEATKEIVCPYCGLEFNDSNEIEIDEGNCVCDECGKVFEYCRTIEITYSTSKNCVINNEQHDYKLFEPSYRFNNGNIHDVFCCMKCDKFDLREPNPMFKCL